MFVKAAALLSLKQPLTWPTLLASWLDCPLRQKCGAEKPELKMGVEESVGKLPEANKLRKASG